MLKTYDFTKLIHKLHPGDILEFHLHENGKFTLAKNLLESQVVMYSSSRSFVVLEKFHSDTSFVAALIEVGNYKKKDLFLIIKDMRQKTSLDFVTFISTDFCVFQ